MACRPGKHSAPCGVVEGRPGYCACGCSVWGDYCEAQREEQELTVVFSGTIEVDEPHKVCSGCSIYDCPSCDNLVIKTICKAQAAA